MKKGIWERVVYSVSAGAGIGVAVFMLAFVLV